MDFMNISYGIKNENKSMIDLDLELLSTSRLKSQQQQQQKQQQQKLQQQQQQQQQQQKQEQAQQHNDDQQRQPKTQQQYPNQQQKQQPNYSHNSCTPPNWRQPKVVAPRVRNEPVKKNYFIPFANKSETQSNKQSEKPKATLGGSPSPVKTPAILQRQPESNKVHLPSMENVQQPPAPQTQTQSEFQVFWNELNNIQVN
jgi:hypothetical protein